MNRKQFIESQNATCSNWTWSWSFINKKEKVVIFGAWDIHSVGNKTLIFSKDWRIGANGRIKPGFSQSREHIRLIEEDGYRLKTFPMKYSDANTKDGVGPAKIEDFEPKLTDKILQSVGEKWYASDGQLGNTFPEEVEESEIYFEGASKKVAVNSYERNSKARAKCIEHYGAICRVCSFDFGKTFGAIGEGYIHVHHIVPLSEIRREYVLDPVKDLVPVCPNCHAIIHTVQPRLTAEELRTHLERQKVGRR